MRQNESSRCTPNTIRKQQNINKFSDNVTGKPTNLSNLPTDFFTGKYDISCSRRIIHCREASRLIIFQQNMTKGKMEVFNQLRLGGGLEDQIHHPRHQNITLTTMQI